MYIQRGESIFLVFPEFCTSCWALWRGESCQDSELIDFYEITSMSYFIRLELLFIVWVSFSLLLALCTSILSFYTTKIQLFIEEKYQFLKTINLINGKARYMLTIMSVFIFSPFKMFHLVVLPLYSWWHCLWYFFQLKFESKGLSKNTPILRYESAISVNIIIFQHGQFNAIYASEFAINHSGVWTVHWEAWCLCGKKEEEKCCKRS